MALRTTSRLERIEPFYVMELAKEAGRIAASAECDPARGGERMIFLNIGEPDFGAPDAVLQAATRVLAGRALPYTQATGRAAKHGATPRGLVRIAKTALDRRSASGSAALPP